jgi:hypothetical protein
MLVICCHYGQKEPLMNKYSQYKKRRAHPNTYLIANLLLCILLSIPIVAMIWLSIPVWWFVKVIITALAIILIMSMEHWYLTGLVGFFVEHFFADKSLTEKPPDNSGSKSGQYRNKSKVAMRRPPVD